jgi:hypothetical protein
MAKHGENFVSGMKRCECIYVSTTQKKDIFPLGRYIQSINPVGD